MAGMAALGLMEVAPAGAQDRADMSGRPPPRPGPIIQPPGYPYPVYVLPVQPKDDRTPRQRCLDEEAARIGGTLSDLDRRAIDLKCSQR